MDQPSPRSNWSLSDDARHKTVNKIMDTLLKHMPLPGTEGMKDLRKIASRFEEKMYTAAADEQDYLRRISLKMVSLETIAQGLGPNLPGIKREPLDPGLMTQPHVRNSSQTLPNGLLLPGQSQPRHQLQQNLQNSIGADGMQNSSGLASALPSISNLYEGTGGQGFGTQSSVVNHSTGQVLNQGALLQRQIPIRQQQHQQQVVQKHQQAPQQLLYQWHLQQQQQALLKQKFQQQSQLVPSMLQQQQQHQQPVMQQNQLPTSQHSIMQPVQPLQSTQQSLIQKSQTSVLQPAHQPILQQTQQSSLQQISQSLLQHHQQHQKSAIRHQQLQQVAMQQQSSILQQQQPSAVNVSNMHQQQHQLQQILQSKTAQHQQTQQPSSSSWLSQSQQLQQQSQQQQIHTQLQTQPQQLQQQQPLLSQSNALQHELQKTIHPSGCLLQQQQQNFIEQQKQLRSTAQSGQPTVDMQEKIFQRLQRFKEMYIPEIKELFLRLHQKSQQPMPPEQAEKLQQYKSSLQLFVQYLSYQRGNIPPGLKEEKLDIFEKQLQTICSQGRQNKPVLQQQGQHQLPHQPESQVQCMQQQSQPPIPQMQRQEKHVNQRQQMNLQAQVTSMQSYTVSPIQPGSIPLLQQSGVQTSQQNTGTAMQTGTNLNLARGTGVGSLQQSSMDQAVAARDTALLERDQAIAERDRVRTERDQLMAERDRVRTERDQLMAERDQLQTERDDAIAKAATTGTRSSDTNVRGLFDQIASLQAQYTIEVERSTHYRALYHAIVPPDQRQPSPTRS